MTGPHESGPAPQIRRQPATSSSLPLTQPADDARTHIIRRAPLGTEPPTTLIAAASPAPPATRIPSAKAAIATSAVAILGGWATSVVATDLITGWWAGDRVFSLAVGFLALLFAATTVPGVILLLRHSVGRWLIVFGSAVALLTFGAVFLAGARVARPVYLIPVLPLTSLLLALHPATRRWSA